MSEPEIVPFKPRWMRGRTAADGVLEETPATGSLADVSPRIDARLLLSGGSNKVGAKTLAEVVRQFQAIVQHAGRDEYHGPNPDFADLRSLPAPLVELTTLTIEPFEIGSFVIPARLEAAPLSVTSADQPRQITTDAVARRFDQILASFGDPAAASQVSIGAIEAVEGLGRVVRQGAKAIEFSSSDTLGQPRQLLRVDDEYVGRVRKIRESRRPTTDELETIEGKVTALDIREWKLQLSVHGQRPRVTGQFSPMLLPSLLESLGRHVRLQGNLTWRRREPVSMRIVTVELLGDDR